MSTQVQYIFAVNNALLQHPPVLEIREGHWMYMAYTMGHSPSPLTPNLLPGRVVTATRLQLYDPKLHNKYSVVNYKIGLIFVVSVMVEM